MVNPSDLLVLLAVARTRTHLGAAAELGLNHTTVARRLKALEQAVGERLLVHGPGGWELTPAGRATLAAAERVEQALRAIPGAPESQIPGLHGIVRVASTEVFGLVVVIPALASVRETHPHVGFELAPVVRPGWPYGKAHDIEIGVTQPPLARMERCRLVEYDLGLFASTKYLRSNGTPTTLNELGSHTPIYYIESMLEVPDLDLIDRLFPKSPQVLGAMSVLAQFEMTRLGLGIGILPEFLAHRDLDLKQVVIPDVPRFPVTYWMSARSENLRRPEVRAVANAIQDQTRVAFSRDKPSARSGRDLSGIGIATSG
jgi:DNA-binding transcriptional LysR family regulator